MESNISITDESHPKTAPKTGSWASMNAIQRTGVITLFPCSMLSVFCSGRLGTFFGLLGWTSILLGYVAGNLWRFRHAVHFWWSVAFACVVHSALLPVYTTLVHNIKNPQSGKEYMYLAFWLVIAETLSLLFVLKRAAMWLHKRIHKSLQSDWGN